MSGVFRHIYLAFKQGDWCCGFEGRDRWPGKSYFSCGTIYYDGYHWALHIWKFYIAVSY